MGGLLGATRAQVLEQCFHEDRPLDPQSAYVERSVQLADGSEQAFQRFRVEFDQRRLSCRQRGRPDGKGS